MNLLYFYSKINFRFPKNGTIMYVLCAKVN